MSLNQKKMILGGITAVCFSSFLPILAIFAYRVVCFVTTPDWSGLFFFFAFSVFFQSLSTISLQYLSGLAHVKKPALKKPVFIAGFFGFFQVKFEKNW